MCVDNSKILITAQTSLLSFRFVYPAPNLVMYTNLTCLKLTLWLLFYYLSPNCFVLTHLHWPCCSCQKSYSLHLPLSSLSLILLITQDFMILLLKYFSDITVSLHYLYPYTSPGCHLSCLLTPVAFWLVFLPLLFCPLASLYEDVTFLLKSLQLFSRYMGYISIDRVSKVPFPICLILHSVFLLFYLHIF